MNYDTFKYLHPIAIGDITPPVIVFTNGKELHVYNSERERLHLLSSFKGIDFRSLSPTGNWFVYSGEYKDKVFLIWDVLVNDGREVITDSATVRNMWLFFVPKIDGIKILTDKNK